MKSSQNDHTETMKSGINAKNKTEETLTDGLEDLSPKKEPSKLEKNIDVGLGRQAIYSMTDDVKTTLDDLQKKDITELQKDITELQLESSATIIARGQTTGAALNNNFQEKVKISAGKNFKILHAPPKTEERLKDKIKAKLREKIKKSQNQSDLAKDDSLKNKVTNKLKEKIKE